MVSLSLLAVLFLTSSLFGCSVHGQTTEDEQSKDSVKLTVFYDASCPQCSAFMVDQLQGTWLAFQSRLQLDLVPQISPPAVLYNMLQACVIQEVCGPNGTLSCPSPGVSDIMKYVVCMDEHRNSTAEADILKCAPKAGLDMEAVSTCASGDGGDTLQRKYNKKIVEFKPLNKRLPTIVINDVYDEDIETKARQDLMQLISSLLN